MPSSPLSRTLDIGQPINWANSLNRGLVSRWQAIPQGPYFGGNYSFDLTASNDGLLTNSPTWSGPLGRAGGYGSLSFDSASSQYVTLPSSLATMAGTAAFTVSLWAYSLSSASAYCAIGDSDNDVVGGDFEGLAIFNNSGQFWARSDATGGESTASGGTWVANTWYLVTVTYGGSNLRIYANGIEQGSAAASGALYNSNTPLNIGRRGNWGTSAPPSPWHWNGLIDDVRVWNRALSAGEVYGLDAATRQQHDPTLNWIRPRKYFFVSGGTDPAEGSGSISAVALLAGTGYIATSGSGTVNAVGVLAGVGYVATSGTGAVAAVGTLAGSGYVVTSGSGSVQAVGLLAGTGYIAISGSGSIAAVAILVGVGAATDAAEGSGSISAVATLVGVGYRVSEGTGAPTAVATLAGTGYRESVGTGQVVGVAILVGVGEGEAATVVAGPYRVAAWQAFVPGSAADGDSHSPGSVAFSSHTPGSVKGQSA